MSAILTPARRRTLLRVAAALAVALTSATLSRGGEAGGAEVGGTVISTLGLSLGEPSPFARSHGGMLYTATIPVRVTATDVPASLSLADGEALKGRRRGRLRGSLQAAVRGPYRSLDGAVDPVLERWREPVSSAAVTIRLRRRVRGARRPALGAYQKLLLVTVTAGGP